MIRTLIIATFALAALTGGGAAQTIAALDQGHPTLRAHATVSSEFVRIGDLVENAGSVADIPIFRAPDLGSTGAVSAETVVAAVRAHALVGIITGGLGEVEVTRASRAITTREIEHSIAGALAAQFALGDAKNIVLTLDQGLRTRHVAPGTRGEPRVTHVSYDPHNGRFNAALDIPTGASGRAPLRVAGRAVATVEVATLVKTVARGAIIKDTDVMIEHRPRTEVGRDAITDRAQIVGKAARVTLQAGRPLRATQLMRPEIVQRNEQVTLVYQVPGIMLTVRGKAAEGGAEGDVISVLNEQSKRTLQGIVAGPGRVIISTGSPRVAANLAAPKTAAQNGAR